MTSDPDQAEDNCSSFPALATEETQRLLDILLSHRKELVQEGLGLPHLRTKAELRTRLLQGLADGSLMVADLLRLLSRIEGWGDLHVTLYRAPATLPAQWMDKAFVTHTLLRLGIQQPFDAPRAVLMPPQLTLSSVAWTADRLRIVWAQGLQREERLPERDLQQDGVTLRAYRVACSRRVAAFDWDLVSGDSMLMIQRMPSIRDTMRIREQIKQQLDCVIAFDQFALLRVSRAIRRIEQSGEARCRQVAYLTPGGDKLVYTSAGRAHTLAVAPDTKYTKGSLAGLLGDFYWPNTTGTPGTEVHVKIHGAEQRVAFLGETNEKDVRYVLSRIRHYCRPSS